MSEKSGASWPAASANSLDASSVEPAVFDAVVEIEPNVRDGAILAWPDDEGGTSLSSTISILVNVGNPASDGSDVVSTPIQTPNCTLSFFAATRDALTEPHSLHPSTQGSPSLATQPSLSVDNPAGFLRARGGPPYES